MRDVDFYSPLKDDVSVNDNGDYQITVQVPGVKKDQITIEYKNNHLEIRVESKTSAPGVFREEYRIEEGNIIVDGITAKLEDGILTVIIPAIKRKVRQIKIE